MEIRENYQFKQRKWVRGEREREKNEDLEIVSVDCRYARIGRGFNFITPSIQFQSFHNLREKKRKGREEGDVRIMVVPGSVAGRAWKCVGVPENPKNGVVDKDSRIVTGVGFL